MAMELSLEDWLEERRQNALRIAKEKRGDDRQGWLEDASYFSRAGQAVVRLVEASGDDHANCPLRMYIALKILNACGAEGFTVADVPLVRLWIRNGMKGPVPWPTDREPFVEWAERCGFARVGEYIGFRFQVSLCLDKAEKNA